MTRQLIDEVVHLRLTVPEGESVTITVGTWQEAGMVLEQQPRAHILIPKREAEEVN